MLEEMELEQRKQSESLEQENVLGIRENEEKGNLENSRMTFL